MTRLVTVLGVLKRLASRAVYVEPALALRLYRMQGSQA